MAEEARMTVADVVANVLAGEHGDFVREAVAVVLEAYVNGVSTRKVDRLVEQLGIQGMSKDRVSALCRALDGPLADLQVVLVGRAGLEPATLGLKVTAVR